MPADDALVVLQRVLADILTSSDPVAALRQHLATPDAPPELRAIDDDGLGLAALLVGKLRFERLIAGSGAAAAWFDRDGRGFTRTFTAYRLAVPPLAEDPIGEAAAFAHWCEAHGHGGELSREREPRP